MFNARLKRKIGEIEVDGKVFGMQLLPNKLVVSKLKEDEDKSELLVFSIKNKYKEIEHLPDFRETSIIKFPRSNFNRHLLIG